MMLRHEPACTGNGSTSVMDQHLPEGLARRIVLARNVTQM